MHKLIFSAACLFSLLLIIMIAVTFPHDKEDEWYHKDLAKTIIYAILEIICIIIVIIFRAK